SSDLTAGYHDGRSYGGEGYYFAGAQGDDVFLDGRRSVDVVSGSHDSAGNVRVGANGVLDGGGEVMVDALGGQIHLQADEVLVNNRRIVGGTYARTNPNNPVSVPNNTYQPFLPTVGTLRRDTIGVLPRGFG